MYRFELWHHKVTSSIIIILKIEVFPRQPLGTLIFKPWKGPKSEENDPLLPEGWLQDYLSRKRVHVRAELKTEATTEQHSKRKRRATDVINDQKQMFAYTCFYQK